MFVVNYVRVPWVSYSSVGYLVFGVSLCEQLGPTSSQFSTHARCLGFRFAIMLVVKGLSLGIFTTRAYN